MTTAEPDDLPCREFVELVTDYLDDALAADMRSRVEAHVAGCEGCSSVLGQWREIVRLSGRLDEDAVDELDPATRASLMEAFRAARRRPG